MKKLAILVAIAVAGLVVFNYVTTGEVKLAPSLSKSDEEQSVSDLQREFSASKKQYAQAYRTAAASGLDTTGDADAAIGSVKLIKRELEAIRKKLTEDRAKREADELWAAVREFEASLK